MNENKESAISKKKKINFQHLVHAKFLFYTVAIAVLYFFIIWLVNEAKISDLEGWSVPKVSELKEPIKLLIQAGIVAIIAITIFYLGKFHDSTRSYISKLGEFEEAVCIFTKSSKPKRKEHIDISKKTEYFNEKLSFQKTTSGLTITITTAILIILVYSLYKIFQTNITDVRENFLYIISLVFAIVIFFFQWHSLDYMLNNRQDMYYDLVSDTAKLKSAS